jgi:hypothetical protein
VSVTDIQVLQMPPFKRRYKKLHLNQKAAVDTAIRTIIQDPERGERKRGDLAGVYVYKFDCLGQQMLLAYEWDPTRRVLLALGVHENFYRDLKH